MKSKKIKLNEKTGEKKVTIKQNLIIGVTFPAVILLLIASIVVPSITNTKIRETLYPTMESYYNSIRDNLDSTLEAYSKQLEQLNCYRINENMTDEEIGRYLYIKSYSRPSYFDYLAFLSADGYFYTDLDEFNGGVDYSKENDYLALKNGCKMTIYGPVTSKATGKEIIRVSIKADNADGFWVGMVDFYRLHDLTKNIHCNWGKFSIINNKKIINTFGDDGNDDYGYDKDLYDKAATWKHIGKEYVYEDSLNNVNWKLLMEVKDSYINKTSKVVTFIIIFTTAITLFLIMLVILIVSTMALKDIKPLDNAIVNIASGDADLTKSVKVKAKNEIGNVAKSFNLFVEKLRGIISSIKDIKSNLDTNKNSLNEELNSTTSAITQINANINAFNKLADSQNQSIGNTASAMNQIAGNIDSLNRMIENQSSATIQATSAVGEMISNINSIDANVEKMSSSFESLSSSTNRGNIAQKNLASLIASITEKSNELSTTNRVISNIASQTNILAMNATIEAAHAGIVGAGFGVVADEIRKLAEDSTKQSKEIQSLIKDTLELITNISETSRIESDSFKDINENIYTVNQLIDVVKTSLQEQVIGSKQINESLSIMNNTNLQVKNASEEMLEGNKLVLEEISKLKDISDNVAQSMNEMKTGGESVLMSSNKLTEVAESLNITIKQIGNQVDLFRV